MAVGILPVYVFIEQLEHDDATHYELFYRFSVYRIPGKMYRNGYVTSMVL